MSRSGFAPDRRNSRRPGGVTGAVDHSLAFPNHTAIEVDTLQHGRITIMRNMAALSQDAAAFVEFFRCGQYTIDLASARAPGGAWPADRQSTDAFLGAHASLDPAVHNLAAVHADVETYYYRNIVDLLAMEVEQGSQVWLHKTRSQQQVGLTSQRQSTSGRWLGM
eukprot:1349867-Amphidinium_carterae.1